MNHFRLALILYYVSAVLLITGCNSSEISLRLEDTPELNWISQPLFMQNVRVCRTLDHCAAEQLFTR